jgi:hypothetical protein
MFLGLRTPLVKFGRLNEFWTFLFFYPRAILTALLAIMLFKVASLGYMLPGGGSAGL